MTLPVLISVAYACGILTGALLGDDDAVRETAEAVRIGEELADETGYRDYWDRYRAMAITGLRGTHEMGRGDAMTTVGPISYPGVPK